MEIELGQSIISIPLWISILTSIVVAFIITTIVVPSIITISNSKRLFDDPEQRSSHTTVIPTLGGAAVFLGMVVPTAFFGGPNFDHEFKFIFIGLLILFFIGIKDDIMAMSARKKLLGEISAIAIIAIMGDIRVTSFHGLMGVNHLPYFVSILFTLFLFIVIINGFNLIDGIDGLSAGVAILSTLSIGTWFILIEQIAYAGFSFAIAGSLLAFFRYNVFGKKNKIFLGDTGSLIIGLAVSILIVQFLESSLTGTSISKVDFPAPSLAIGILIIPLMDTLRVFTLRILVGKSPFEPDRFHTHHKFLLLGFSHLKTTLIILSFNLMVIIFAFSLRQLGNILMLLIIIPSSLILTSIPGLIFRYKVRKFLITLNMLGNMTWILPVTITNLIISHIPGVKYKKSDYLPAPGEEFSTENNNKDLDRLLKEAYILDGK